MGKKIVLVAQDTGPSQGLKLLGEMLAERGHNVAMYLSLGKPFDRDPTEFLAACEKADMIVTGFSHTEELSEQELEAISIALKKNKPIVLFSDNFGMWGRPWFAPARERADVLFVQSESDASQARDVFPNTDVIVSGNPAWENMFFPPFERAEVRKKLGIKKDEKLIMLPTSKTVIEVGLHIGMVIEAMAMEASGVPTKLVATIHPAVIAAATKGIPAEVRTFLEEKNPELLKSLEESLARAVKDSYKDMEGYLPIRVLFKDEMSSQEVLCGADLVITGCSSTGNEAACMRIPTIDILHEAFRRRWEMVTGSRAWEPGDLGISRVVDPNAWELSPAIEDLLDEDGAADLRDVQEKVFPAPSHKGAAAEKMADAIEKLLG